MFYETLVSSDPKFKHDIDKAGRIYVDAGSMTAPEIVKEMEWIVPGDHQWDLRPVG
jgi:hypothetical protein